MQRVSPPLRKHRLGRLLRDLRSHSGMSLNEAAVKLGWSTAKVSRVETGQTRPSTDDVAAVMDLYGVGEQLREECMTLARQAAARPWWWPYREVLGDYVALETEATLIRYWQQQLIPGQFQTEEYARAVIAADAPWEDSDVLELKVAARLARQTLASCEDPVFIKAVIGEDALLRPVGGRRVMRAQLDKLAERATWDNVEVRVVPRRVGAHPGLTGSFVILSLPASPTVLFREGGLHDLIEQPDLVREYEMRFAHIVSASLPLEDSLDLIATIMKEI